MRKKIWFVILLCFATSSLAGNVYVEPSRDLVMTQETLKAGHTTSFQLNLTGGAVFYANFTVQGGANNKLTVWLMDEQNFQLYQNKRQFRYFDGTTGDVRGVGQYKFQVPATGRYYLVLDNTKAFFMKRRVSLYGFEVYPFETSAITKERLGYEKMYKALKEGFEFNDFNIYIQHCGMVNAFSNPNITICRELESEIVEKRVEKAGLFVLFHELGHTLLKLWDYPSWDSEDTADEFATVMSIMFEQEESARHAARWWAMQGSRNEAIQKLYVNDRHTISPQRARNIDGWLARKDDLMHRWQKIFVPNMKTDALKSFYNHPRPWVDKTFIQKELARRPESGKFTKEAPSGVQEQKTLAVVGQVATPTEAISKAIESVSPVMTAIAVAISEGMKPGRLPTTPSQLGLQELASYKNEFVQDIRYDRNGSVTLQLPKNGSFGAASGRRIVLTPISKSNSMRWHYGFSTTVPKGMLPELP